MEQLQSLLRGKTEEIKTVLETNKVSEKKNRVKLTEVKQSLRYVLQNLNDLPRERLQHLQTQLDSLWSQMRDILKNIENLELQLLIVDDEKLEVGTELLSSITELSQNIQGHGVEKAKMIQESNLILPLDAQNLLTKWLQGDEDRLRLLKSIQKERMKLSLLLETILSELEVTQEDIGPIGRTM